MGCDIHLYVEKCVDGKWVTADTWKPSEYEDEGDRLHVAYGDHFYDGRNYDLFAILANVRNGYGFAGIPTGAGFVPIAMPRGIPDDACKEYKDTAESWDSDGHSHSWLTVAELLTYDWTQKIAKTGVVSLDEYFDWNGYYRHEGNGPRSYSGGVSGQGIETVSESEFIKRVKDQLGGVIDSNVSVAPDLKQSIIEMSPRLHIQVAWGTSYYLQTRDFWGRTMPRLIKLANDNGGFDNVRICFFFDN